MTNTMTNDVEATVQQVYDLNAAGADLVRVSVNGSKAQGLQRSPLALFALVRGHPLRLPDGSPTPPTPEPPACGSTRATSATTASGPL